MKTVLSSTLALAVGLTLSAAALAQESLHDQLERATAAIAGLPVAEPAIDLLTETAGRALVPLQKAGPGCTGGIIYDDGVMENGYRTLASSGHNWVMEFLLPAGTNRIDAICTCFQRAASDPSVTYRLNVYAADGPGGRPGTLLGFATPNTATPPFGLGGQFFRVEIPGGLAVATNRVYIGPSWSELLDDDFFVCADENGPGGHPAYFGGDLVSAPANLVSAANTAYRALGVRIEASAASNCVPSATALCLGSNGRFRVEATFATTQGQSGSAQVVKLTEETGYLWFFSSTNVEAVVKILNGCGLNSKFWVFAGGLTNVNVVLEVTDTQTGLVRTYTNPQGTTYQPIQDTSAFGTCP